MKLNLRDYLEGDYKKHIESLTKDNMEELFIENFGGWSDSVSEKKFFSILNNGFVKLFFSKDVFVGYVTFNLEKNDEKSCLINDIHLLKKFQRKGHGTEILKFIEEKVKKLDCNQLKVFVFENNPSLNFYKKNGFEEIEYLNKSNTCVLRKFINNQ